MRGTRDAARRGDSFQSAAAWPGVSNLPGRSAGHLASTPFSDLFLPACLALLAVAKSPLDAEVAILRTRHATSDVVGVRPKAGRKGAPEDCVTTDARVDEAVTEAEQERRRARDSNAPDCGHSESVARLGRSSRSPRTHTSPVHRRRLKPLPIAPSPVRSSTASRGSGSCAVASAPSSG